MSRSGEVYQFRMWVAAERKYIRKSLKTTDHETAIRRAEKRVFRIISDLDQGKAIFGATLGELIEKYLNWREEDVKLGRNTNGREGISEGRLSTIKSQCRAVLRIKSQSLKISELDPNSFYDWQHMCQTAGRNITSVTVRNETATLNHIFGYGYRQGLCHFPKLNFRPVTIRKDQIGRRGVFSLSEYDNLVAFMRKYVSKNECPDEDEREERRKIRDLILILSNTCLRIGELKQLTWADVIKTEEVIDNIHQKQTLVHLWVRPETSKTRSSRRVVSRGGQYFERLRRNSKFVRDTDFLFTDRDGIKPFPKKKLYAHWSAIMTGAGLADYKQRKLYYYSLRHFGITCRIRSEMSMATLAQLAGTSVTHIEKHYAHVDDEMLKAGAMKNFRYDESGIDIIE